MLYSGEIKTIDNIKHYLLHLDSIGKLYHLEDDCISCGNDVNGIWEPTFSNDEAIYYNAIAAKVWAICDKLNICPFTLYPDAS